MTPDEMHDLKMLAYLRKSGLPFPILSRSDLVPWVKAAIGEMEKVNRILEEAFPTLDKEPLPL